MADDGTDVIISLVVFFVVLPCLCCCCILFCAGLCKPRNQVQTVHTHTVTYIEWQWLFVFSILNNLLSIDTIFIQNKYKNECNIN